MLRAMINLDDLDNSAAGRILAAATAQIRSKGSVALRIQDICADAGVSRTSFYREFQNLGGLLTTIAILDGCAAISEAFQSIQEPVETISFWRHFIQKLVVMTTEHNINLPSGQRLATITAAYRNDAALLERLLAVMRAHVTAAQRANLLRNDLEADILSEWMMRQAWALNAIPFVGPNSDAERLARIDQFVLPSLLCQAPQSGGTMQNEIREILQVVRRLERRNGGRSETET